MPVGFSALLPVLALALFAYNGYDWPLYFGEETHEPRRVLPRAVMVAAASAVVIEIVAVVAATLAIHNSRCHGRSRQSAGDDRRGGRRQRRIKDPARRRGGRDVRHRAERQPRLRADLLRVGSRPTCGPPRSADALATTNRNQVPKWAFAFLGLACAVFCYLTSLTSLITFTSVMIVTVYLLIATAAIVSRIRERDAQRSFRMPLWPLPPLLAIAGIGLTLRYQKFGDIIITLVTIAIAVIYWLAYLHRNTRQEHGSESAL